MSYDLYISGSPRKKTLPRRLRDSEGTRLTRPAAVLRRFPPVLQFLTTVPPSVEEQLNSVSLQAYRGGNDLEGICNAIYDHALNLGFKATIGVQEVYSSSMPSFPDQMVMSALLLVDLQRVRGFNDMRSGLSRAC